MKKATAFFTLALAALLIFVSCGEDPFFHIVKVIDGDKTTEAVFFNGDEYTLPANSAADFLGWKVNDDKYIKNPGEKITINGKTSVKAIYTDTEDESLCLIMYVLSDSNYTGSFADSTKKTVLVPTGTVTLPEGSEMKSNGGDFDGWYTAEDADGNREYYKGGAEITVTSFTKLYANWTDPNLKYETVSATDSSYKVSSANDTATSYKISEWYQGKKVTVIAANGFQNNKTFTTITIPKTIETIGLGAFGSSTGLSGTRAENLTTIIFAEGSSLKTIDQYAFGSLKATTNTETGAFVLPASVTTINDCAFQNNNKIKSFTIPAADETTIATQAFYYCGSLESITIGSGIVSIGPGVFDNCDSLKSITIQKSADDIKKIPNYDSRWTYSDNDVINNVTVYDVSGDAVV